MHYTHSASMTVHSAPHFVHARVVVQVTNVFCIVYGPENDRKIDLQKSTYYAARPLQVPDRGFV